jgi:hypothetical protein
MKHACKCHMEYSCTGSSLSSDVIVKVAWIGHQLRAASVLHSDSSQPMKLSVECFCIPVHFATHLYRRGNPTDSLAMHCTRAYVRNASPSHCFACWQSAFIRSLAGTAHNSPSLIINLLQAACETVSVVQHV